MKLRQRLCSIILVISIFLGMSSNVFAKDINSNSISNSELEKTIEGIIHWAKKGTERLLNPEFLEMAGTTPGDWFPIGIGRYRYKDDYRAYISAIDRNISERYKEDHGKLHPVKATEWHRISLAVLSMGGDPTNIGEDENGKSVNLISDGTYNCIARRGVNGQGINGAIWALISMDSLKYEVPTDAKYTRDDIIKLILEEQLPDGGFSLGGKIADPDITAMAMQALAPYYNSDKIYEYKSKKIKDGQGKFKICQKTVREVLNVCINLMGEMQGPDGDYFSWGTQNVESTVQVLTALCSLGIDCERDPRFIKNGKTLIDGIIKYRNDKDGGFLHSYKYDPQNPSSKPDASNNMASEQTLYGLVSYWRLRNNMRNLYDFRPETNQEEFIVKAKNNDYSIAFNKNKQDYTLELQSDVKEISFTNIPIGPYDISNIKIDNKIKVKDKDKIELQINNRQNQVKKYVININIIDKDKIDNIVNNVENLPDETIVENEQNIEKEVEIKDSVKISNIINNIENLPKKITLKNEEKILKIEKELEELNESEKAQVSNIQKFNKAKQELKEIKQELEKKEIAKRKNILDRINKLSNNITLQDKKYIYELSNEVNNLNDFPEKEEINQKLKKLIIRLQDLKKAVKNFDNKIFEKINPMNITLNDKKVILDLIKEYESFNEKDRQFIQNYNDVLSAEKIIYELENNKTIINDVFENIIGSDVVYTFQDETENGSKYTISFKGTEITNPQVNFNAKVSSTSKKNNKKIEQLAGDAIIFSFFHEGKLPGKAKVNIDVALKDGKYFLYYFNDRTQKAELVNEVYAKNGEIAFEIQHCSDYFISSSPEIEKKQDIIKTKDITSSSEIEKKQDIIKTKDISSKLKPLKNLTQEKNIEEEINIEGPKTGDNTNVIGFVVLFVLSGGLILFLSKKNKM